MLTFKNISFQYESEDFNIINDLSFQIREGEFVSMIGPSGCGKSTIFRLVNQLLKPKNGVIFVDGRPIEKQKYYCGYMPQEDLLFPWRSVAENMRLALEIQGKLTSKEMNARVERALRSLYSTESPASCATTMGIEAAAFNCSPSCNHGGGSCRPCDFSRTGTATRTI